MNKITTIETAHLCPRVLRASFFNAYTEDFRNCHLVPRRCYDYELEFYTASDGGILVDDDYIEFKAGEVNLRRPGQVVCGVYPYSCYIICFSVDSSPKSKEGYVLGTADEAEPNYTNPLLDLLPNKILPQNPEVIQALLRDLCRCFSRQDELSGFRQNKLLWELLNTLFSQEWAQTAVIYNRRVVLAAEYIREHFCENISVQELIKNSGISKTYFHKCFKSYTKTSPTALMTALRIERAKTLLHLTLDSVADIGLSCGYLDNVYFTHLFRKTVGMTPTNYRRNR